MDRKELDDVALAVSAARAAYYGGCPTMSDADYDALEARLRTLDPDHWLLKTVGAPPSNTLKKTQHTVFMGSLDNAFTEGELNAFLDRVKEGDKRITYFVVQPKCDGLSVNLSYRSGILRCAATRGDGHAGEDVTANLFLAQYVPRSLPVPADLEVRGEVVIYREDHKKHFAGEANTRNSAAGTCRRQDGKNAQHLRFIAFDATPVPGAEDLLKVASKESEALEALERCGFRPVPHTVRKRRELAPAWQKALEERSHLPYDVDGVVIKVNNKIRAEKLGWSDTCPRSAIAGKWRGTMSAETTIIGAVHSVGRTGVVTPVALVTPVVCGGVTISRVSLMNWAEIERLEERLPKSIGLGAVVRIERAGDVIPRITQVIRRCKSPFPFPSDCPSCGAEIYRDGPRAVCANPACPAQTARQILHWIRQRNILYLGEETLNTLMEADLVEDVADLYQLRQEELAQHIGQAMATKILAEIEKSRHCTLPQVLGSVGIPGIGETEATKVCNSLQFATLTALLDADLKTALAGKALAGFGQTKLDKLLQGLETNRPLLRELSGLLDEVARNTVPDGGSGVTFCITGATQIARHELIRMLQAQGWTWHSSVVNGLTYLIAAEAESGSKKAKDAQRKGIQVVTESQALQISGAGEA